MGPYPAAFDAIGRGRNCVLRFFWPTLLLKKFTFWPSGFHYGFLASLVPENIHVLAQWLSLVFTFICWIYMLGGKCYSRCYEIYVSKDSYVVGNDLRPEKATLPFLLWSNGIKGAFILQSVQRNIYCCKSLTHALLYRK